MLLRQLHHSKFVSPGAWVGDILHANICIYLFHLDIQTAPYVQVITLFEGVQLSVVGATISVNLGSSVPF